MADEFRAYYFTLSATGVPAVDKILETIAEAGSGFHHTDNWTDPITDGSSYVDRIQAAAVAAAKVHADLLSALKALDNAMCGRFDTSEGRFEGRKALIAAREAVRAAEHGCAPDARVLSK